MGYKTQRWDSDAREYVVSLDEALTSRIEHFTTGLERAAKMVEAWANGNTPITVDEIAAAIRKEKEGLW